MNNSYVCSTYIFVFLLQGGGMDVALPYVWQYNENYTHTVHIDSNRMTDNRDFGITIRGHFARVYIVNNTITDNFCHDGLLAMKGMEKEVKNL